MDETIFQQIFNQISKATSILIALPPVLTADNMSAGLSLRLFLQKLNKEVLLVSSGQTPPLLGFLPGAETIQNNISSSKHFVISLNISQKKVDEVSYQSTNDERLDIFIKPKNEEFSADDVSFRRGRSPFDLIFVLDVAALDDLGSLFEQQTDIFFEIPKINIDTKTGNSYFGAINYIDINASSLAEMLAELFGAYEDHLIDEDIATMLLTGIITKTNSFQHIRTTPKTFLKASELVAMGGRQQEVVRYLYKTKPLHVLKLWGRVLARLKTEEEIQLLYSFLGEADFDKSGAIHEDMLLVLKELIDNISGYTVVAILSQEQQDMKIFLALHQSIDPEAFSKKMGVSLTPAAELSPQYSFFTALLKEKTSAEAESRLLVSSRSH